MAKLMINCLSALRGGGKTYIHNLLSHSGSYNDSDMKITLLLHKDNYQEFKVYESNNISVLLSKFASKNILSRVIYELFFVPIYLIFNNYSFYFAPGGVMISPILGRCQSITALRNMLPFDSKERKRFPLFSYIRFKLWLLKSVFLFSYKISDKVIFISNHSRDIVSEYIPDIECKSKVIYHGINSIFLNDSDSKKSKLNVDVNNYYLYVSIFDVYKSQKEIVNEWIDLRRNGSVDFPLVLVGPIYNSYGKEVLDIINDCENEGYVIHLGEIAYEKLPDLYKGSRALIFGSSCECCPNILLEKIAAHRPILCSSFAPMPEFAEDCAIYFDPYVSGSLSRAVLDLEFNDRFSDLTLRTKVRSKFFDWNKTALETFRFINN